MGDLESSERKLSLFYSFAPKLALISILLSSKLDIDSPTNTKAWREAAAACRGIGGGRSGAARLGCSGCSAPGCSRRCSERTSGGRRPGGGQARLPAGADAAGRWAASAASNGETQSLIANSFLKFVQLDSPVLTV